MPKKLTKAQIEFLASKRYNENILKQKRAEEARLTNNRNRVFVFRSNALHTLPGKGNFRIAHFMFPPPEQEHCSVVGHRKSMFNKVFCFVLDNKNNDLNIKWNKAQKVEFVIRKTVDYEKVQKWYDATKKKGFQISSFYTE